MAHTELSERALNGCQFIVGYYGFLWIGPDSYEYNPGGGGGMSHWGLYIIRVNKNA